MAEQIKEKSFVRKEKLHLRNGLADTERVLWSKQITEKILENPIYLESQNILVYSSYQSEVDTKDIILDSLQRNKKVFCPKVHGDVMEFYQISSLDDLLAGYKGIREPIGSDMTIFQKDCEHKGGIIMILPLAAFNTKCQRIGYGKGYYDKYLSALTGDFHTIGIAYDMQYEPNFIADDYDYPLEYIITEKQIYKNGGTHLWNI